ncbi:hypothetical protein FQN50_005443 [Emmonsiellopsis sp. PD_5]|nr:hypothetical protein FQN50_005443 [Emmonsiellopsis sp. PD_5]
MRYVDLVTVGHPAVISQKIGDRNNNAAMEPNNDELESFRRQWREEVAQRAKGPSASQPRPRKPARTTAPEPSHRLPPTQYPAADRIEDEDLEPAAGVQPAPPQKYEELVDQVRALQVTSPDEDSFGRQPEKPPTSALEHFEAAAQKEAQGNLGSSLDLYRKAYRLDSKVDQVYRKKHFPPALHVAGINPPGAPVTVPNTVHRSQKEPILSTPDLIASFAACAIPVADPAIENTPPPPCPISKIPSEVLVEVLRHVALMDPASFGRLSLVCKRLAYHFAYEQRIWRRLCQGSEFGFGAMHYDFVCDVKGRKIHSFLPEYTPFPFDQVILKIPRPLTTWSQVFQTFPRIRFTGIYISTVNYTRPGAASALQHVSWNAPIHIVTYYRYLRFYPDGSLISLLTTTEPIDVVPHISKENLETLHVGVHAHRKHQHHPSDTVAPGGPVANPIPPIAAAALKNALRGRWHLNNPSPPPPPEESEASTTSPTTNPTPPSATNSTTSNGKNPITPDPRDLFVETEGVDPKYTYIMHLALRSVGTGASRPVAAENAPPQPNTAKNTKLMWKGFWSYNRTTEDWAEFGLRNGRAFVFRRVRGWGMPG